MIVRYGHRLLIVFLSVNNKVGVVRGSYFFHFFTKALKKGRTSSFFHTDSDRSAGFPTTLNEYTSASNRNELCNPVRAETAIL